MIYNWCRYKASC